jgi:hypothetical protein
MPDSQRGEREIDMAYDNPPFDRIGEPVYDVLGQEIGKVRGLYPSKRTASLSFVAIETTLGFDKVLPLKYDTPDPSGLHVSYSADEVNSAPSLKHEHELTPEFERSVTEHFRMYFGDLPGDPEVPYNPPPDEEKAEDDS